jgi:hypothetical protein
MGEVGGSSENSWEVWWKEEHEYVWKLSLSWRVTLATMRCGLYTLIGIGLLGHHVFDLDAKEATKAGKIALVRSARHVSRLLFIQSTAY